MPTDHLPFNPEKAKGSRHAAENQPQKNNPEKPYTVSQINEMINQTLVTHLPRRVRILGEISNLSTRGHWYFSLKDDQSVLRCVAWKSKIRNFGFNAENGMEVVATGSIQHYGPQGQTQLYVDRLESVGAGPLELRFRELCEKLRNLGYFDPEHKKSLPTFPRTVAVITSSKGAALQDVLNTMQRRCPAVGVVVVDVLVQGEQAAPQVVRALQTILRAKQANHYEIDAVIITRGGGSLEDLWAFNEPIVAEALYQYPIPTVAAIGHETDTTIAELVADVRCATPTQAAMVLTPDRTELTHQLTQTQQRLTSLLTHKLRFHNQHLATLRAQIGTPKAFLDRIRDRTDRAATQLHRAWSTQSHHYQTTLTTYESILTSLDPSSVLRRGYSITRHRTPDGQLITSTKDVSPDDQLITQLHDGHIHSRVESTNTHKKKQPKRTTQKAKTKQPDKKTHTLPENDDSSDQQMDLFSSN